MKHRDQKHHDLKIAPEFFDATIRGRKQFEVRRLDRDYRLGDTVVLHEWSGRPGNHYTGRRVGLLKIVCILDENDFPQGLRPGYGILGLIDALDPKRPTGA